MNCHFATNKDTDLHCPHSLKGLARRLMLWQNKKIVKMLAYGEDL